MTIMKNVKRKNGFINLDELANDPSFRMIPWRNNESMVEEFGHSHIKYIFYYNNEIYIYKTPDYTHQCYYELIAEELAHDFSIPTAHYDLAYKSGEGKGVISKNFKLANHNYIKGYDLLKDYVKNCLYKNKNITDFDTDEEIEKYNCLEGIWTAFEYRYLSHPNRIEIVNKLMSQLVDMFIFDTLTGQTDRYEENWGIVENDEEIFLQPLYDNEFILFNETYFYFTPHTESNRGSYLNFNEGLKKILSEFLSVSDDEFIERLKEKIPLITKENIDNIILRIEKRIEAPIPKGIKKQVSTNFKKIETIVKTALSEYEEKRITR